MSRLALTERSALDDRIDGWPRHAVGAVPVEWVSPPNRAHETLTAHLRTGGGQGQGHVQQGVGRPVLVPLPELPPTCSRALAHPIRARTSASYSVFMGSS